MRLTSRNRLISSATSVSRSTQSNPETMAWRRIILPLVLGPLEAAAVGVPAQGGDPGALLVRQQALEVDGLGEEVEAQLDELGPAVDGLLELDLHHLVPGAGDDDADPIDSQRHVHGLRAARRDSVQCSRRPRPSQAHPISRRLSSSRPALTFEPPRRQARRTPRPETRTRRPREATGDVLEARRPRRPVNSSRK